MKKIKLISSLSAVGTLACTTPYTLTSCSNNDECKLNMEISTDKVTINSYQTIYVSLVDKETTKPAKIKEINSFASSNPNILSVKEFKLSSDTLGEIKVFGENEGESKLSLNLSDNDGHIVKADFKINVVSEYKPKTATVKSIRWIDKDDTEVTDPILDDTYLISDIKLTSEGQDLDFNSIRSIVDNGSDPSLNTTQTVDPNTGVITISITVTELGEKSLKLKFEFYNSISRTASTTYVIDTKINIVQNHMIAVDRFGREIPNNTTYGVLGDASELAATIILFKLGYIPEGERITYAEEWNHEEPSGEYRFTWDGLLTVKEVPLEDEDQDVLTVSAKNGEETLSDFTITLQKLQWPKPLDKPTVIPTTSTFVMNYEWYKCYWTINESDISKIDASATFTLPKQFSNTIWIGQCIPTTNAALIEEEYSSDPEDGLLYWIKLNVNEEGNCVFSIRKGATKTNISTTATINIACIDFIEGEQIAFTITLN